MHYILDTNIVSLIGVDEEINNKLSQLKDTDNVSVSILTIYEYLNQDYRRNANKNNIPETRNN